MTQTKEQRMANFQHKTFVYMFRILFIFGIPAFVAFLVGDMIDNHYTTHPYGKGILLVIACIFSWVLFFRMYLQLEKERKEIEAMKDTEDVTS